MSIRSSTDNGEIDGYFGKLDMEAVQANPRNFEKLTTPEGMKTTLHVGRFKDGLGGTIFIWRCRECGNVEETATFKRPFHICDPKTKAEFKKKKEVVT